MWQQNHAHFITIEANTHAEFGYRLGQALRRATQRRIKDNARRSDWRRMKVQAKRFISVTQKYFPQYLEEFESYARGAAVDFFDLWTVSLEDEVTEEDDKCTTVITNNGRLLIHNEDWYRGTEDLVWVLHKRIGTLSTLELYYVATLGGNAVSINSNGFTVAVNSLMHKYKRAGVPHNVIARWLSETKDPAADYERLQKIPRSRGCNFNIINRAGKIWNIELTSRQAALTHPSSPFVHTNHYLSALKSYNNNDNKTGTVERYAVARTLVKKQLTVAEALALSADNAHGPIKSIMNERTVAKMIMEWNHPAAHIWLLREKQNGWVRYSLKSV